MRIDSFDDETDKDVDEEIKRLILSAEVYLKSHGVKKDYDNALYKTVLFMVVSTWYENRCLTNEIIKDMPIGVTRIISQLNMLNDYGTI